MRQLFLNTLARLLRCHHLLEEVSTPKQGANTLSLQHKKLLRLLNFANKEISFFRNRFTEFLAKTSDVSAEDFFHFYSELPTYTKRDYLEAGSALHSSMVQDELSFDKGVCKGLWALRQGDVSLTMSTGGSSKLPLSVKMSKEHMLRLFFSFFRCWREMGWQLGDKVLVFYPRGTYNIDDLVAFNSMSFFFGFKLLLFDAINEKSTSELLETLESYRPKLLMTFPSPLNLVCHIVRNNQIEVPYIPPLINVSGETFFDCQRRNIQSLFKGSNIGDSYGSVEFGEIAHETDRGYEIFADLAYAENIGRELVVTTLDLMHFPFIRYRIGDIAKVTRTQSGQFFQSIDGKAENCLIGKDSRRLYPSALNQIVNELNECFNDIIVEIKVQKSVEDIEVLLITKDSEEPEGLAQELVKKIQAIVGQLECRVSYVSTMKHDYRRKYRVIENRGEVEYVGGVL